MASDRSRTTLYWTTQVVAWTGYMLLLGLPGWMSDGATVRFLQVTFAMAAIGIISSHVLRGRFQEWQWIERGVVPLMVRMITGALVMGSLAGLLQAGLHDMVFPEAEPLVTGPPKRLLEVWLSWVLQLFLWELVYVAYQYVVRGREEKMQTLRLEAANREGQLANLRSQLNPHFMFNALNSIRSLIEEDPARAKQSITLLSAILRNAMATVRRRTVPLGEEIDTVKAYLTLEAVRYEERLGARFDVDPVLERSPIPPMMLQTLVENAVRHGIAKMKQGGEVLITARPHEEGMLLRVSNTGYYGGDTLGESGIGLRNTRDRLHHLYGGRARFDIRNEDGKVVCEIYLPAETEPQPNEMETSIPGK